jgi:heat shock protein HslJ
MKTICLGLLVLMVFVSLSCQTQVSPPNDLLGKEWRLTDWSVSTLHPADFMITATFTPDSISGRSVVNQYTGHYTLSKDAGFSIDTLTMTEMGGSEEEMNAEKIYFELLNQAKKYILNPSSFRLLDENNNELLIFAYLHK